MLISFLVLFFKYCFLKHREILDNTHPSLPDQTPSNFLTTSRSWTSCFISLQVSRLLSMPSPSSLPNYFFLCLRYGLDTTILLLLSLFLLVTDHLNLLFLISAFNKVHKTFALSSKSIEDPLWCNFISSHVNPNSSFKRKIERSRSPASYTTVHKRETDHSDPGKMAVTVSIESEILFTDITLISCAKYPQSTLNTIVRKLPNRSPNARPHLVALFSKALSWTNHQRHSSFAWMATLKVHRFHF